MDDIGDRLRALRNKEMERNVALHFTDAERGLFNSVFTKMNRTPIRLNRVLFWGRSPAIDEIRRSFNRSAVRSPE